MSRRNTMGLFVLFLLINTCLLGLSRLQDGSTESGRIVVAQKRRCKMHFGRRVFPRLTNRKSMALLVRTPA